VTPVFEGASELEVAEAVEPAEVFDEGVPWNADRGEGDGTDGDGEARARAGGDVREAREGLRGRRRWDEGGVIDAGALPGGHEAGEVCGVCKEGEDGLDGVGEMLLGVEAQAHTG